MNMKKFLLNPGYFQKIEALLQPKKPFPITKLEDVAGCRLFEI